GTLDVCIGFRNLRCIHTSTPGALDDGFLGGSRLPFIYTPLRLLRSSAHVGELPPPFALKLRRARARRRGIIMKHARPARVPRDGGGEAGAKGTLDACRGTARSVATRRRDARRNHSGAVPPACR